MEVSLNGGSSNCSFLRMQFSQNAVFSECSFFPHFSFLPFPFLSGDFFSEPLFQKQFESGIHSFLINQNQVIQYALQ